MRILQFTLDNPFPPISGGEIRNALNARALAGLGEVLNVHFAGRPATALPPNVRQRLIEAARGRVPWQRRSPHPTIHVLPDDELAEATTIWKDFAPDLVMVEDIALSQLLTLAAKHGGRTVIDMHNIDSHTTADRLRSMPLWRRLRRFHTHRHKNALARQADIAAGRLADQVWVCSETDRKSLLLLGPVADIRIIANPIPDETVLSLPITPARYARLDLCFIGHLGYFPNVDAVRQLGRKMVPRLAAAGREWSITVAGKNPLETVRQFCASHGLRLVADPPRLPELLAAAGYAPMPLRYGGGTRIKALEAMAAGLVVCATPKAVEGLGLQSGLHYLAGRDADDLAGQIVTLAARPEQAVEIATAGRAFVQEHHMPEVIEAGIRQAVSAIAPASGSPTGRC